MQKMMTWSLALASLLVAAAGCSEKQTTSETTAPTPAAPAASIAAPATTAYTCPMHPAVVSAHPGKCPKCGMDLVVKK